MKGVRRGDFVGRLWSKVDRRDDGCWLWTGNTDKDGYGMMHVVASTPSGATTKRAHRLVYEAEVGPIPNGMQLDHLCKVRCCVNPAHLEPVTPKENVHRSGTMGNKWNAGKPGLRGESNGHAKLTGDQVDHIRVCLSTRILTQPQIGFLFGVHPSTISAIAIGRTWSNAS